MNQISVLDSFRNPIDTPLAEYFEPINSFLKYDTSQDKLGMTMIGTSLFVSYNSSIWDDKMKLMLPGTFELFI